MARICLATCYLRLEGDIVDAINSLGESMRVHGLQLCLIATSQSEDLNVPCLSIPYLPLGLHNQPVPEEPIPPLGQLETLIAQHRMWRPRSVDDGKAQSGIRHTQFFFEKVMNTLQPAIVLLWDKSSPLSRMLDEASRNHGIPTYNFERGFLPKTLMVDCGSFGIYSELACSLTLESLLQHVRVDHAALAEARRIYQSGKWEKYTSQKSTDPEEKTSAARADTTTPIGIWSQFIPSGIYPRTVRSSRDHFPLFEDYYSAIETTVSIVKDLLPNARIYFRDHPLNLKNSFMARTYGDCRVLQGHGGHHLDLMSATHIDIFLGGTTLQFESFLMEKPTVQLGRTSVECLRPYYSPLYFENDLRKTIVAALERQDWDDMRQRIDKTLWMLMEHYLYGYGGAPVRHSVADLGERLAIRAGWMTDPDISLDSVARQFQQLAELTNQHGIQ
ncbi:MAG: hypothetical protein WBM65_09075 [Sedimenticolaceae bacterium]